MKFLPSKMPRRRRCTLRHSNLDDEAGILLKAVQSCRMVPAGMDVPQAENANLWNCKTLEEADRICPERQENSLLLLSDVVMNGVTATDKGSVVRGGKGARRSEPVNAWKGGAPSEHKLHVGGLQDAAYIAAGENPLVLRIKLSGGPYQGILRRGSNRFICEHCGNCVGADTGYKTDASSAITRAFTTTVTDEKRGCPGLKLDEDLADIKDFPEVPISEVQRQATDTCSVANGTVGISLCNIDYNYGQSAKKSESHKQGPQAVPAGQLSFYSHLVVRPSRIHGLGVFTTIKIPEHTYLMMYEGELVGKCLSDKRERAYRENNIESVYMFKITEDLIVDATFMGNKARYINHSCDPNCYSHTDVENRYVSYYTGRDIESGEELAIDYHFDDEGPGEACQCGVPNCRSK